MDGVVDTERDAVQVAAVGLLGAGTVEDQLVLGVADVDVRVVVTARVSAGGRAVGRAARALRLGDVLAVGDGSDVGALAAVGAGSDGLRVVLDWDLTQVDKCCLSEYLRRGGQ